MSKTSVLATLTAQPGKGAELKAAITEHLFPAVDAEPGTELYVLNEDPKNPDVLTFFEIYSDRDAFKAHGGSDAMKVFGPIASGLLAGAPQLTFLTVVGGKGA